MKKISEIREELKNTPDNELAGFIEQFSDDERDGVKKILEAAKKRIEKLDAERRRIYEISAYEREFASRGLVCGIDEVGRGPLAGPVVAAAVILPADEEILYINDSKKLSAGKREELSAIIMEKALAYGFGESDHIRIDEINILNATYEAMRQAINNLGIKPDILLNDAVTIPDVSIPQVPIIKGDAKSVSIGAASIIAKVKRDAFMDEMDKKYPGYGFASNKGYGSAAHIEAIKRLGPCEIHRRTYIGNFI